MNKNIRFWIVLVVMVVVVVVAAGGSGAWASPTAKTPEAVSYKINAALPAANNVGTVSANGCSGIHEIGQDQQSICAVATLQSFVGTDVRATQKGGVVNLQFMNGSAVICFAAHPLTGSMYFDAPPSGGAVVKIPFYLTNGIACATVSESGFYWFE
jgi:hypothetical protein